MLWLEQKARPFNDDKSVNFVALTHEHTYVVVYYREKHVRTLKQFAFRAFALFLCML